jgi:hypothetical protein
MIGIIITYDRAVEFRFSVVNLEGQGRHGSRPSAASLGIGRATQDKLSVVDRGCCGEAYGPSPKLSTR